MNLPVLLQAPLKRPHVWIVLGWLDVLQSYRRSVLGPIWITLNMFAFCSVTALMYGSIFNIGTKEYIAYLVCGMIAWVWISALVTEGGNTFQFYAHFIRGTPLDKALLVWAMAYKQFVIFGHNMVVFLGLILLGAVPFTFYTLLAIPAALILFLQSIAILAILSILFVRYRDLQRLTANVILVLMFITPIFWKPDMVAGWRSTLVYINPFYYQVELLRRALLGQPPDPMIWGVALIILVGLWSVALAFFARYQRYVAFWI